MHDLQVKSSYLRCRLAAFSLLCLLTLNTFSFTESQLVIAAAAMARPFRTDVFPMILYRFLGMFKKKKWTPGHVLKIAQFHVVGI